MKRKYNIPKLNVVDFCSENIVLSSSLADAAQQEIIQSTKLRIKDRKQEEVVSIIKFD